MKIIISLFYLAVGIAGFVQVLQIPGHQLVLAFCCGAVIGNAVKDLILEV